MSYLENHWKVCSYCNRNNIPLKPTIRIKGASSKRPTLHIKSQADYNRQKKLTELGAIVKGVSYSLVSIPARTKGASEVIRRPGPIEREVKLKQLGKLVRG